MRLHTALPTLDWTLGRLAAAAGYGLTARERIPVTGVQEDSRLCVPGDLFVAIPGTREDGTKYARDALRRGAVAVAAERNPGEGAPWMRLDCARQAAGKLADLVYGDPSRTLPVVGVTGTNGKTTTAHLIAQLLPGSVGTIGTLGIRYPGFEGESPNTTPAATALRRHLKDMIRAGCGVCVMEVSSHALHQARVAGLRFRAAVYTNLSGDHLDYHGTMEAYAAAKASLFEALDEKAVAIVNARDQACSAIRTRARVVRFAAREVEVDATGTRFVWRGHRVRLPLIGRHNAENAAAALATIRALGLRPAEAVELLGGVLPVRGRLEPVQTHPFLVLVDYAHTDDGLEKALRAVREVTKGRVITVFGCGGDRDRSKRPRMGAVAARWADRIIVTNDNPRGEEPRRIAKEVVAGMGKSRPTIRLDRREAILEAIGKAKPGDTVLIAGKGHETHQIVGQARLPFDDATVAREALSSAWF